MSEDSINNLSDFFSNLPEKFSVLEEPIDLNIQMEYFDASKRVKEDAADDGFFEKKDLLFNKNIAHFEKKLILVQLASLENIEAFRTIEKYKNNSDEELKDWAALAFLESKTVIENSLTNEHHVIISTGLGGKGSSLRYFVVLIAKDRGGFTDLQEKLISSELDYALCKFGGEIETLDIVDGFAALTCLIPLKKPVKEIFSGMIKECNLYGDFLQVNFIITNIKVMKWKEIKNLLENDTTRPVSGEIDLNRWE